MPIGVKAKRLASHAIHHFYFTWLCENKRKNKQRTEIKSFILLFSLLATYEVICCELEFTAEVESKCKQPVQTIYSRSRSRKAALVFVVTHDVKHTPAHIVYYNLPSIGHTLSNSKNAVSWCKLSGLQNLNNDSLSAFLGTGFKIGSEKRKNGFHGYQLFGRHVKFYLS